MIFFLFICKQIFIISTFLQLIDAESNKTSVELGSYECDPFATFVKYCGADGQTYDGCQIKCEKQEILSIGRCSENMKPQPKIRYKKTKLIFGKNTSVV